MADGIFTPMPLQSLVAPLAAGRGKKEERIPQWSFSETGELIAIRAELEKDFTQTKRNKTLWELIAGKMREKGFRRSADQCKCKWKNLVNRYKGKEISDPENGRHCPFFDELDAVFKARLSNAGAKLLLESDGLTQSTKTMKKSRGKVVSKLSDEDSEEDEEEEVAEVAEESGEVAEREKKTRKRKADKERQRVTAEKYRASSMQEVLEEFFQQQQRMEEQWRAAVERQEAERRAEEEEWRERVEKAEEERAMREQAWWEHEEARRAEDELRSHKRDELLTALVMKIARDNNQM